MFQLNPQNQLLLTPQNWAIITGINTQINQGVQYKSDMELYNKPDFWEIAKTAGDCEDYALAKRHALLLQGVPKPCLRLAVCQVDGPNGPGTGEWHAVLLIETDRGTYTLDNRHANVLYFKDLPYRFDRIQRAGDDWWVKVN